MIKFKNGYITNCTFVIDPSRTTNIISENENEELVIKFDKLWIVDEKYLTEEMKKAILNEVHKKHSPLPSLEEL